MAVGQPTRNLEVLELSHRIARQAGYDGIMSTEFKYSAKDKRYYFIEFNPRPGRFHSIGWRAGFDLTWLAYSRSWQCCDSVSSNKDNVSSKDYFENVPLSLHRKDINMLKVTSIGPSEMMAITDQVRPHNWILVDADLASLIQSRFRVGFKQLSRPYFGDKEWAVFAADDIRPFFRAVWVTVWRLLGRIYRILMPSRRLGH